MADGEGEWQVERACAHLGLVLRRRSGVVGGGAQHAGKHLEVEGREERRAHREGELSTPQHLVEYHLAPPPALALARLFYH